MNQYNPRQNEQHQQNTEATVKASEAVARAGRDTVEHTTRVAREATEQTAREVDRIGREAVEISERSARAGADAFAHNADAMQGVWQSGVSLATQLSEQSFEQFERMLGLASERTKQASRRSSRHVEAIMQSSALLAAGLDALSREWIDFAHHRVVQQRDRLGQALEARTPHDFAAIQTEIMRDSIEDFFHSFRRVAETSARLTEDAVNKMAASAERSISSASQ
jgi:hypothetical protein